MSTDLDKKVSLKQHIFGHSGSFFPKKTYDPFTNTTGIPSLQMETPFAGVSTCHLGWMEVEVRNFHGSRRFFGGIPNAATPSLCSHSGYVCSVEFSYRNGRDNMLLPQFEIVPAFKKLPMKYMGLKPQTQFTKPTWKVDGMYAYFWAIASLH